MGEKIQLNKQLYERDFQVIDAIIAPNDAANVAFDLYTTLSSVLDYTNMQVTYGEMQWIAAEFNYVPYFQYSDVDTDSAIGCFGVRQGTFDVTVSTKTAGQIIQLPGSQVINNKKFWRFRSQIVHNNWVSTTDTNTAQSEVPKINFYFGYVTPASTNTGLGLLHIKLLMNCKAKKE